MMSLSIEQQVSQTFKYLQAATSANYLGFTLLSEMETTTNSRYQMSQGAILDANYHAAEPQLLSQMKATLCPVSYADLMREVLLLPISAEQNLIAFLALGWEKPMPLIDLETSKLFVDALSISLQVLLAYDENQYYVQALEFLGGLSTELNSLQSIEDVLIYATHIAAALLEIDLSAIFLAKDNEIERVFASGLSSEFLEKFQFVDILDQGEQASSHSVGSAQILTLDGNEASKIQEEWHESFKQENIYAYIKASVQSTNRYYGCFWLVYGHTYLPTPHHVRLIEILVSQIATTLENIELTGAIQGHADTLEDRVAERTAALAIALEQATAADRLKTQLLNVVSHELKTPLSVIKAQSSTMVSYFDRLPRERQIHYIETINEEADRLTWMINNMLDMSRLEAGTLAVTTIPTNPAELLTKLMNTLHTLFSAQPINLNIEGEFPDVLADSDRVAQLIINLVENAVKYSPAGKPIEVGARAWADALEIWVSDQGYGLAPEHTKQVFDRFFQVFNKGGRPTRTGVGLGLAICKGLVEGMGGHIWCQSEGIDKGCKFSFTLRWATESPVHAPPMPASFRQDVNQK